MTLLSSLFQFSQTDHGCALCAFFQWHDKNFLDLNVSKTKEMITDLRKNGNKSKVSIVHGEDVQMVMSYKHLGILFDFQFKFDVNKVNHKESTTKSTLDEEAEFF